MGDLTDRIKRDVSFIVTEGGVNEEITLTPPSGDPFTVQGIPVRINQMVEEHEGSYVNTPYSHISIMEQDVIDAGFSIRINKLATMRGWGVSWTDSIQTWSYTVSETMADDTLGIVNIVLKDDN